MSARGASGRGSSKRPFKLTPASEAVENLARDLGLEPALRLNRIRKHWATAVGTPMALHTWPAALSAGRLTVNADTPAWLQQVGYFRQKVLEKLSPYGVKDLKFRIGRISRPEPEAPAGPQRRGEPDYGLIDELLEGIEDEELRESVRRAAEKSLAGPPEEEG